MSVNWVMLQERDGFVRLPREQSVYASPPRTSISLQQLGSSSGKDAFSLQSSSGQIYLTNQRVVYIPAQKSDEFQSFSAPLLNVRDSHVTAPFFGPNAWVALVQPVSGGGIPPGLPAIQIKVTFKEGGAFDFHNRFERIKERLEQAVEVSRESARGSTNVDMSTVHLEELPAYSAPASEATGARAPAYDAPSSTSQHTRVASETGPEFMEPPPGYEEVQQQSVANELEERLRRTT